MEKDINFKAPYKKLLTYRYAVVIYHFTKIFTAKYMPGRDNLRDREQWNQAGRSSVRCIAEGAMQGTSLKGYLKMLGVTRGSHEELLEDVIEFARDHNIVIWPKNDPKFRGKKIFIQDNQPIPPYPPTPQDLEIFVNIMIDMLIRENYLIDQQKRALEDIHMKEGGYTEKLYNKRKNYLKNKK